MYKYVVWSTVLSMGLVYKLKDLKPACIYFWQYMLPVFSCQPYWYSNFIVGVYVHDVHVVLL